MTFGNNQTRSVLSLSVVFATRRLGGLKRERVRANLSAKLETTGHIARGLPINRIFSSLAGAHRTARGSKHLLLLHNAGLFEFFACEKLPAVRKGSVATDC